MPGLHVLTLPQPIFVQLIAHLVAGAVYSGVGICQVRLATALAPAEGRTLSMAVHLSLVGLTAAILGTCMGLQGVYAVQRIDELLFGLELRLRPPPGPIIAGWVITLAMTLAAAAPGVLFLARKGPRDLLGAMKG